jgi:dihydroceramidase
VPAEDHGFWGEPTASVDWCETNYAVSPYIAEFYNTVSSLAIVLVGVLGLVWHARRLERRFSVAFLLVSVVGLGSMAFHATLRMEHQMLDELPMLYSALVMVFILVERDKTRRFGWWFPALLTLHGVFVTALTALTRGSVQFYVFQFSFGTLEFFCLYRVWCLTREPEGREARRLFRFGLGSYALAIVCWFIDLRFCRFLQQDFAEFCGANPELHAVWHVLVSLGFYLLLVVIAFHRSNVLGRAPRLSRGLAGLPRVSTSS